MAQDNPPAFPRDMRTPGMSLRDWFAGQVLVGILASEPHDDEFGTDYLATRSYKIADAMLAERSK